MGYAWGYAAPRWLRSCYVQQPSRWRPFSPHSSCGTVAYAAYPGVNGKLVVSDNLNGFHNRLVTMNPDGSARTPITPDDFNNFKPAWSLGRIQDRFLQPSRS